MKVGDRIICVNKEERMNISIDKIYQITSMIEAIEIWAGKNISIPRPDLQRIAIINDLGETEYFNTKFFKLVKELRKEKIEKLKVL